MFITIKFLTLHIINRLLIEVVKYPFSMSKLVYSQLIEKILHEITFYARKYRLFLQTLSTDKHHYYKFLFLKEEKKYTYYE